MHVEHFIKTSPIDITCRLLYNFSISFTRFDATGIVDQIFADRSKDSLLIQCVTE